MMKLVIFDLDDTLIHLDVDWAKVKEDVLRLAQAEGIAVDPAQHLIILSGIVSQNPKLKTKVDEIYRRHEAGCVVKKSYTVYREMIALVRELKNRRVLLGMASGNHTRNILEILKQLGMEKHFDVICGRDRTVRNKPDPEQLLMIMKKTRISKRFTIFVGDSRFDELAAKAAGVMFFRVEKGGTKDTTPLRELIGLGSDPVGQ